MRLSNRFCYVILFVTALSLAFGTAAFAKGGKGNGNGKEKTNIETTKSGSSASETHVTKEKVKVKETTVVTTETGTTGSRPPGWDRGKKTGWQGGKYPPGWTKWNEKEQIRWVADRDQAHTEIMQTMATYNIPVQQRDQIRTAFDEAILGGIMVNEARKKLVSGLADPNQRKNLMINTTQSVLEFLK